MSQRGPLTAVITTVLGVTFGGVLAWCFYQTKRKRLPSFQKVADPAGALRSPPPPPLPETEVKAGDCGTQPPPAVHVPTCEQLLAVQPLMVSCEEEWQQLWPRVQQELSLLPVLGFDCEWVKALTLTLTLIWETAKCKLSCSLCGAAGVRERQSVLGLPAADGHLLGSVCPGEAAGLPQPPAAPPLHLSGAAPRRAPFESRSGLLRRWPAAEARLRPVALLHGGPAPPGRQTKVRRAFPPVEPVFCF